MWIWILISIGLLHLVAIIMALVDISKKLVSSADKLPWILIIISGSIVGISLYYLMGSKHLDEKSQ